jgi:hypothetical protein
MQHTIKQMLEKINVMQQKALLLEKEHMNKTPDEVQYRIEDIQALAGDIYNDRG